MSVPGETLVLLLLFVVILTVGRANSELATSFVENRETQTKRHTSRQAVPLIAVQFFVDLVPKVLV